MENKLHREHGQDQMKDHFQGSFSHEREIKLLSLRYGSTRTGDIEEQSGSVLRVSGRMRDALPVELSASRGERWSAGETSLTLVKVRRAC
jgi:hypothetical protein